MHPSRLMLTVTLLLAALILCACQPFQSLTPGAAAPAPESAVYWPTTSWRTSTPEEQGIDSAKLAEALLWQPCLQWQRNFRVKPMYLNRILSGATQ